MNFHYYLEKRTSENNIFYDIPRDDE